MSYIDVVSKNWPSILDFHFTAKVQKIQFPVIDFIFKEVLSDRHTKKKTLHLKTSLNFARY